ncbi:hypothetical protein GCM10007079_47030 [Nocardiopsis terrae]|nr:hypothetical protein GCM10007079_47030 [Nocardiopsis terrae]
MRDLSELVEQVLPVFVSAASAVAVVPADGHVCLKAEVSCGVVREQGSEQVGAQHPGAERSVVGRNAQACADFL